PGPNESDQASGLFGTLRPPGRPSGEPGRQPLGVHVGDGLDGHHRVHARGGREAGRVGDDHIGHLPGRAVRVERAVVLAAAHPGRSHDVQRGDAAAARLVTGSRAGRGELLVRTLFAWTITRAGLVAGVDLLRPGRL